MTFSPGAEAADSNLFQPYATFLLHPFPGRHGWNWRGGECNELGTQAQEGSFSTTLLILLLLQECLILFLHHQQLNIMPNALSLAFSCRKWPLYVALYPIKLIMTKTGVAQAASELDGFSGPRSASNMPGNSIQVLTVAREGAACLDWSRTMVLLPLLIFDQCVCQLR